MKSFAVAALVFGVCLASSASANASSITLSFNSLPSAQGWSFSAGGATESNVFAVNGTELIQNTIGQGDRDPIYNLLGAVNFTDPFVLSITAKVDAAEGTASGGAG